MKSILWKELRENAKWASLAVLLLILAQCFALASGRSNQSNIHNNLTIVSAMFLMVTSFGCAFVGAAIGALQVLPEQARDQWAALLHCPAGRGVIFSGKVVAGLLLVSFATGLPLIISVIYVQMPGQFAAPLVPGMIYPGFSDLFLGVTFYFAALAVSLNRGKWWGVRGMIALSLLPVFVFHVSGPRPILGSALAAVFYLLTGWGAMSVNGAMRERAPVTRWASVAVILAGSCSAIIIIGGLILLIPIGPKPPAQLFQSFQIGRDGTILISSYNTETSASALTDLDGKAVTEGPYASNDGNEFLQSLPVTFTFEDISEFRSKMLGKQPRSLYRYLRVAGHEYDSPEVWYYLVDQKFFVGYDKLSRRKAGFFGREGFVAPEGTPEPFKTPFDSSSIPFWKPYLYAEGPQIYDFKFGEREMLPFFHAGESRIVGFSPVNAGSDRQYVAAALEDALHILGSKGEIIAALPYRHDPNIWGTISVAVNPALERIYVEYQERSPWFMSGEDALEPHPAFLAEHKFNGDFVEEYELPARTRQKFEPGILSRMVGATIPFAPAAITALIDTANPRETESDLISSFGLSLVLSLGAWLLARRVGFSPRDAITWSVFVFCFGLPGLIAFRLGASWPTQVRCPDCSRPRAIEAELCLHCNAAWSPPLRTGQEILG